VIPSLPWMYDEPFADSSQIPTHLVCKGARKGVTVALSGDAGDEMFGGYNRYLWAPRIWRRLGWMPSPMRRLLGAGMRGTPSDVWDAVGKAAGVRRAGEKMHRLAGRLRGADNLDALYCNMVADWLGAPLLRDQRVIERPDFDMAGWARLGLGSSERMMAQDAVSYLPDDIFCKVDRAAMSVSLETRAPFVDPSVIESAWRVPLDLKIRDGRGKWILRQILYGHVPAELIERPKTGFGVPIGQWLRGPLREWAEELLAPRALEDDGLIDPATLRSTWAEHCAGTRDWTTRIWSALMYLAWRRSLR
ncbi:MAG: asparagine synthase C-terminal domain-containing protein, partial [Planctomycetota bacterium]|nr:asparagine synthase C-terminal domain-containing protein [Planctomycetota bacterium]